MSAFDMRLHVVIAITVWLHETATRWFVDPIRCPQWYGWLKPTRSWASAALSFVAMLYRMRSKLWGDADIVDGAGALASAGNSPRRGFSTTPGAPDYVEGASLCLISRRCLEAVGTARRELFSFITKSFDFDGPGPSCLSLRILSRERSFYHIGGSEHRQRRMFKTQNAAFSRTIIRRKPLLFSGRRYHLWFLPSVLAATGLGALQRLMIGRPQNAGAVLRGNVSRAFSRTRCRGKVF